MPKEFTAKTVAFTASVGGVGVGQSYSVDRAQVKDFWFGPGGDEVHGKVRLYSNADGTKEINVLVTVDLSTLDFATAKSDWETANSPTVWADTITMKDLWHSIIHEQLQAGLDANSLESIDGGIVIDSVS